MLTGKPFDDLRTIISQLPEADDCAGRKFREACHYGTLAGTASQGDDDLGLLGAWLARWQGSAAPKIKDVHICLLASSYEGAGDPAEVLAYIAATAKGRAPVNLMCVDRGIGLRALEMAPSLPHAAGAAWSEADCMAAVAFGMEAAASGGDVLGLAALAPGGDVHALNVIAAVRPDVMDALDADFPEMVGWVDRAAVSPLAEAKDPLEALRQLGGREIAGSVGALIAARSRRLPVLVEGYAALAAMVVLDALQPGSCDHVRVAAPDSSFFARLARVVGHEPLLNQSVGIGPGCAVPVALPLLEACSLLPQMPTMDL